MDLATHQAGRLSDRKIPVKSVMIVLLLLVLCVVLAIASGATPPASTERIGFSPGGSFVRQDPERVRVDLSRMAESGAGWVRIDVDWSEIESSHGVYDWGPTDRTITAAHDVGLEVIGLISYTPAWARPPGTGPHHPSDDEAAFAAFAGTAAARYSTMVDTWEIWNEPNLATFWEPSPDAARYASLLVATSAVVRGADPGATILSGGLASVPDLPPARIDPVTFVDALYAAGAGPAFDGVSIHPYTYPTPPSRSPRGMLLRLPSLQALMVQRGDAAKGIWITEFGSPTGDSLRAVTPEQQAEALDDAFLLVRSYPWVRSFLVYSLRDAGRNRNDVEQNFGLRTVGDDPKPAWDVFVRHAVPR